METTATMAETAGPIIATQFWFIFSPYFWACIGELNELKFSFLIHGDAATLGQPFKNDMNTELVAQGPAPAWRAIDVLVPHHPCPCQSQLLKKSASDRFCDRMGRSGR
ncbi:MAG: hypothetical protein EXS16_01770 [Gemmataceae bacterium]|nr:hypothetical protein [Gemmataceae bacterium]